MKVFLKIIYSAIFAFTLQANAQVINLNPDPNAEPWWSGDGVLPTPQQEATVQELVLTPESAATLLPDEVYNNDLIYFPTIFNQQGASCVQAAEIGYTFTYETNRIRNLPAGDWEENKENCYHHLYTYNFLNNAVGDTTTQYMSGFNIIKENGCPPFNLYDDPAILGSNKFKYWMTDYSKYYAGMQNRITGYYDIHFNTSASSLETLKHWIADHNEVSPTGGLAIIAIYTGVPLIDYWIFNNRLPIGTPHENEFLVTQWGTNINTGHALTLVGYDDNVRYDFNGDGQYTSNPNNLLDSEFGAFKAANSWGGTWGNNGFIWIPYKMIADGLQREGRAYVCEVEDVYATPLTIKANITHNSRNELSLKVGYANLASSTDPVETKNFYCFNEQGGSNEMRGAYPGPIEIGLNYGYFYENTQFGKVFFRVHEDDIMSNSSGTINYFSLTDHRWGEDFELYSTQANVPIANNTNTTLSIEYHLLPHHDDIVPHILDIVSNRVSRFTTTINNGDILIVEPNIRIDMYNSEIHIKPGATLQLNSNSKIIARRGNCKIIVDGDIIISPDVQFVAEGDASLEVFLNNSNATIAIQKATFQQCKVHSQVASLAISNSSFVNCKSFYSYVGELNFAHNTFSNTSLYLENKSKNQNFEAKVTSCNIVNTLPNATGIKLINYGKYFISGNIIQGFYNGIDIFASGSGPEGYQKIENNTISSSSMNAIIAYNSIGSIYKNNIFSNFYGVRFMNSCNFALHGNPEAQIPTQTQEIRDNTACEVYASEFSFPWYFRYNSIVDDNNLGKPNDPLLLFDRPVYANVTKVDVRYNHWGSGFDASVDLMGNNTIFLSYPDWPLGGSVSTVSPDQDLYLSATANFEAGNYTVAKNLYQLLIQLYPKSNYAEAAIKDLVRLEEYAGKDFSGLKAYFLTNDSIASDTTLTKLANISANQCDVKMENWPVAISWYENRILDPESPADSIFAVIDLGYVYMLMDEDSLKSQFVGKMPEYRPVSKASFNKNKDYLLSLLPFKNHSSGPENYLAKSGGTLQQNIPNPSNGRTIVSFTLEREAGTELVLSDLSGKVIKRMNLGVKPSGTHKVEWQLAPIASGLYVYSLILDGVISDVKKMSVIE